MRELGAVMADEQAVELQPFERYRCRVIDHLQLWGCYPECSALGIYHLHREPGIPGVATAHFRWDGKRRVEVGSSS